jgi:RNA polymerase sigma-70 factor, ECF subfamily
MRHNNTPTGSFASPTPDSPPQSLLQRVRDLDPDAWDRVVELFGPVVLRWCRQSGLSLHDAADVVQEVWTAVLPGMARFRRDRPGDSFRGWLWTITRNAIRDHFHDCDPPPKGGSTWQRVLEQFPDKPPDSGQSDPTDRQLLTSRLLEIAKAEFEDRTWRAFWRTTVDKLPAADVAAELGMTKKAVRQAKYRVARRLRQLKAELVELLD